MPTTSAALSLSLSFLSTSAADVILRTNRLWQVVCAPTVRCKCLASLFNDIRLLQMALCIVCHLYHVVRAAAGPRDMAEVRCHAWGSCLSRGSCPFKMGPLEKDSITSRSHTTSCIFIKLNAVAFPICSIVMFWHTVMFRWS